MNRLSGASQALGLQAGGPARLRTSPEALALTAACVWLVNSLHARPEDGPAARRLMDAVLPITDADGVRPDILAYNTSVRPEWQEEEEEEEDGSDRKRVPYNPYGCVFLRRLMVGDVPRLRFGGRLLPAPAFKFFFGVTREEVLIKYMKTGIVDKKAAAISRPATNKRRIPTYINLSDAPEPDLFDLSAQGHSLPPPVQDDGSDVDDRPPTPDPPTVNGFLSTLFRQFLIDLTMKSPNPRGNTNPSYMKLTKVERRKPREDIYQSLVLLNTFTAVAYRNASVTDWDRAFKWLFPKPGYQTTDGVQNYPGCPYFITWMDFIANPQNPPELIRDAREGIWKRLREWS